MPSSGHLNIYEYWVQTMVLQLRAERCKGLGNHLEGNQSSQGDRHTQSQMPSRQEASAVNA